MKRLLLICSIGLLSTAITLAQPKTIRVPQDQPTVQAGIDAAVNGDTVLVAEGTYNVNLLLTKKIVLGSLFILDGDTSHISKTILDGSAPRNPDSASVILLRGGTDSTTVISGFTIQKGSGTRGYDGVWAFWSRSGGGILCVSGGVRISHNVIANNSMNASEEAYGAGIAIWNLEGPITDWIIEQNQIADNMITSLDNGGAFGGGAFLRGNGRVRSNLVINNVANCPRVGLAGGILLAALGTQLGNIELTNNLIRGNYASHYGGGLMGAVEPSSSSLSVMLTNNIISDNTAPVVGGAMHAQGGAYTFINNTIVNNTGPQAIEAESWLDTLTMRFMNNIVWNPDCMDEIVWTQTSPSHPRSIEVAYCDVRGGYGGPGNTDSDPRFIPGDPLFNLTPGSPCVGGGVGSFQVGGVWQQAPPIDFDNRVRPMPLGTSPDMGAQEEQITTASTSIGVTPGSINFGSVPVGLSSETLSVKLRNISTHTVIIDSITLQDAQFWLIDLPAFPVSLMPSDSMTFRTLFHPTARGMTRGEIVVTTRGTLDHDVFVPMWGEGVLLGPQFLQFVDRVTAAPSPERSALVDSFMAANPVLPFIEDTIAQFVYRGPVTSLSVPGDYNGWNTGGNPMTRLSTTDLWYEPSVFERDARIEYKFFLNGSTWIIDPHNPIINTTVFGDNSGLEMPAYIPPWEIQYDATIQHGRSDMLSVRSNIRGVTYSVRVYLPYGYDGSGATYPSAYFQDGSDYVTYGHAINVLDNLIASSKIRPTIGVFVTPTNRNEEYAFTLRSQYQEFFVTELVPFIDSVYRTITAPSERAVMGDSYGGNISALISYNYPEVFGNCGLQSGAFWPNGNEAYNLIVNGSVKPIKYYSVWGTYSDVADRMRPFRDAMIAKGYSFEWEERHEGHTWGQWRATIDTILQAFFPLSTGVTADRQALPAEFMLGQNYPNPFNPSTTIRFELPQQAHVVLTVFNMLGQEVTTLLDEVVDAGYHEAQFDASDVASGVYLYRVTAGDFVQTRKMILVR